MPVVTQKKPQGDQAGIPESEYGQVIDKLDVKTSRVEALRRLFYDSQVRICS